MTIYTELYETLAAANHSVSYCAHLMDMDPSDRTIAEYELSLDYAADIRAHIGAVNSKDLYSRDLSSLRMSE